MEEGSQGRHLRGNWLAYWECELGMSERDTMFDFKQIDLQVMMVNFKMNICLVTSEFLVSIWRLSILKQANTNLHV